MSKKNFRSILLKIQVFDKASRNEEKGFHKRIDSKTTEAWISRIVMWAMLNNKYVLITRES